MSWDTAIKANPRQLSVRIRGYRSPSSALEYEIGNDAIQSFTLDRTAPTDAFCGYVVCPHFTLRSNSSNNEDMQKGDILRVELAVKDGSSWRYQHLAYIEIDELERSNDGTVWTISGYGRTKAMGDVLMGSVNITYPATLSTMMSTIATACGFTSQITMPSSYFSSLSIPSNPFSATLTAREAMNYCLQMIASVAYQTDVINQLKIERRCNMTTTTVGKDRIFSASLGSQRFIRETIKANSLGDNVTVGQGGDLAYVIKDNPIFELFTSTSDITTILTNIHALVVGESISQYDVEWRGDPQYIQGSSIIIDNGTISNFTTNLQNDTITYDGGLRAHTYCSYDYEAVLNSTKASTLTGSVRNAYAQIDKANGKISLVVEESGGTNVIKTASIVTAINDSGSAVMIDADKIQMTGTTTFLTKATADTLYDELGDGQYYSGLVKNGLKTLGYTQINGGNITTGVIDAQYISTEIAQVNQHLTVGNGQTGAPSITLRSSDYGGSSIRYDSSNHHVIIGDSNAIELSTMGYIDLNCGGYIILGDSECAGIEITPNAYGTSLPTTGLYANRIFFKKD